MTTLIWVAIFFCLLQSAMFSGLNLAIFSISKLELEARAKKGNPDSLRVLKLRNDSNFVLVTILWGNVSVNVLLALLSDSILAGLSAFLFSTVAITIFAEIMPQAYFSRHALRVASLLSPMLRFYQVLLFPVAKPTAWLLDVWLGGEDVRFFAERDMRRIIQLHMESDQSDIAHMEGQGALNFLDIDDVSLLDEGEAVHPDSIIEIGFEGDVPLFPPVSASPDDSFLRKLHHAERKWAILVDENRYPQLVMNAKDFIADLLMSRDGGIKPMKYCHRPIVVSDGSQKLGAHLPRLAVSSGSAGTEVINHDVILLWNGNPRIISGGDILGRLFRGIGEKVESSQ
jgi:metal transporter CNNM